MVGGRAAIVLPLFVFEDISVILLRRVSVE
jgi:hypothetical protein